MESDQVCGESRDAALIARERSIREHAVHWSKFHHGHMALCSRSPRQLRNALELIRWRGSGPEPIALGLPRGFFKSSSTATDKPLPKIAKPARIACDHCGYVVDASDIKLCKQCVRTLRLD